MCGDNAVRGSGATPSSARAEVATALVPPRWRGPLQLVAAGALTGFAALCWGVEHSDASVLDRGIDRALHTPRLSAPPGLHAVLDGTSLLLALTLLGVAAGCWRTGAKAAATLALTAPLLALALCDLVLKPAVGRQVTDEGEYSFPSGQVTASTAAAAVVLLLLLPGGVLRARVPERVSTALAAGSVAVPPLVSLAVIALHWHYPTDALAGAALAVSVVMATATALDRVTSQRRLHGF